MKSLFLIMAISLSTQVLSKVECTSEPKEKWQDAKTFRTNLESQYKIKVFKETEGHCYEIYGWNKAGKKVEIYFNPVTGAIVKENVKD